MESTNFSNFEQINFKDTSFPFNCFYIKDSNTLPHWHNHFEMILVQGGNCAVYINGSSFSLTMNQLIIIPPGNLHSIFPYGSCSYCAIVSGESLFEGMHADSHFRDVFIPFMSIGLYPPLVLSAEGNTYTRCFDLVFEILKENTHKSYGYQARTKIQMLLFFSYLNAILPETFFEKIINSDSTRIIKAALDYMKLYYRERITVNTISKYSHLSIQHFSRLFKAFTGKTFVEYLTLYRLEQSRKILTGTDIPINQIPDLVGFCNGNYFSRLYKKYYGHPPSRDKSR